MYCAARLFQVLDAGPLDRCCFEVVENPSRPGGGLPQDFCSMTNLKTNIPHEATVSTRVCS